MTHDVTRLKSLKSSDENWTECINQMNRIADEEALSLIERIDSQLKLLSLDNYMLYRDQRMRTARRMVLDAIMEKFE